MPQPFRFGSGDVTDMSGEKTGQLDVVVEFPFLPSLPLFQGGPRLYLAEGVAAVIEVKSNICDQWREVEDTAEKISKVKRRLRHRTDLEAHEDTEGAMAASVEPLPPEPEQIPLFAVGYVGWKDICTVTKHLDANPRISGLLVIEKGLYVCRGAAIAIRTGKLRCEGPFALWGLVACLHAACNVQTPENSPMDYVFDRPSR